MKDPTTFIDILDKAVDKFGTKFVLAILTNLALAYAVYYGKIDGLYGCIGIVLVTVAYFFARRKQEKEQTTINTTEVK